MNKRDRRGRFIRCMKQSKLMEQWVRKPKAKESRMGSPWLMMFLGLLLKAALVLVPIGLVLWLLIWFFEHVV